MGSNPIPTASTTSEATQQNKRKDGQLNATYSDEA